jgi:hypothetical protein
MGMKLDMKNQVNNRHVDDFQWWRSVEEACIWFFDLGSLWVGVMSKQFLTKLHMFQFV